MERVGSEVALIWYGKNKEGACDMLCQDVKMECFCERHNASCGLEPHEKNFTCARATNASGFCAVFTPPVADKGITPHCDV